MSNAQLQHTQGRLWTSPPTRAAAPPRSLHERHMERPVGAIEIDIGIAIGIENTVDTDFDSDFDVEVSPLPAVETSTGVTASVKVQ